mmetsp:Transcript_56617/g.115386  ORF Transcript_56617/g.115386 Transcript_56617/m.115386 type:complete len:232 (-) Transcript_56617:2453-3148(-)
MICQKPNWTSALRRMDMELSAKAITNGLELLLILTQVLQQLRHFANIPRQRMRLKIGHQVTPILVHLPKRLDVRRQLLVDVSAAEEHLQAGPQLLQLPPDGENLRHGLQPLLPVIQAFLPRLCGHQALELGRALQLIIQKLTNLVQFLLCKDRGPRGFPRLKGKTQGLPFVFHGICSQLHLILGRGRIADLLQILDEVSDVLLDGFGQGKAGVRLERRSKSAGDLIPMTSL